MSWAKLGRVTGNLSIYLRVRRGVLEQGLKAREDKMQLKNFVLGQVGASYRESIDLFKGAPRGIRTRIEGQGR